jgi:phosphomannomutase
LAAVRRVEEKYKNEALETSYLDGLWMRFDWGWLSVRLSNTEPVVRLNLEARSVEVMREKINELSVLVKA